MPALVAVRFLLPGLPRLDPSPASADLARAVQAKVTMRERSLVRHQPGGRPSACRTQARSKASSIARVTSSASVSFGAMPARCHHANVPERGRRLSRALVR
jgi:hypothetical protein